MASDYVVPWSEVMGYFKDCREQAIQELTAAKDDREMWRAQGKLALVEELLNLQDIHATMATLGKE